MIISVKGGKLKLQDIRDLIGTMTNESAFFGGMICFENPTKAMEDLKINIGIYKDKHGNKYDRLQILSIKDMLIDKKMFNIPNTINRKDYNKDKQSRFHF